MEKKKPKIQKKIEKKIDPLSLEDVPGIGPTALKLLKDANYTSTLSLIIKHPTFLKEVTGMDQDQAGEAFLYMKKKLETAGYIGKQEMTGTESLQERKKIQRVTTGCNAIDRLLNGGVECKSVTEFYGENGSGKTQLAHTLAVQVQRPFKDGGLFQEGEKPPIVLYMDTENTWRPERIISILAGKKLIVDFPIAIRDKLTDQKQLTPEEKLTFNTIKKQMEKQAEKYLDKIIIQKASNVYQLLILINNAAEVIRHLNIKLILVDSGTAPFRGEFLERGMMGRRSKLMNEMVHDLKLIAEFNNLPIVFVNQIYHSPTESYGKEEERAFGGNIVGHAIPYRLKMEKFTKTHKITIMKSPYQANDEARFKLTRAGLSDV